MLSVVSFAFVDAVNVLLIAVLVTLRVLAGQEAYRGTAFALLAGDWLAVLGLSIVVAVFFGRFTSLVTAVLESPAFGWLFIVIGGIGLVMVIRGSDMYPTAKRVVGYTTGSRWNSFRAGLVLGFVQSVTSAPFFGGLMVLNGLDLDPAYAVVVLVLYATVALSVPVVFGFSLAFRWSRGNGAARAEELPGCEEVEDAENTEGAARRFVIVCTWGAPFMLIALGAVHLVSG
ncbi:hypothetical protein MUG78_10680 [Gordonia alkaliphila]|uniref:hypothetical protein n=1 Tax=Gordonia alkaliphila TaxID=1053547 RepID=UPI001FF53C70|nr:hypothetical protein [Gordonia alkaliphila]MCK0439907.1 hypothetical protein [Gordonia alkaliphila]